MFFGKRQSQDIKLTEWILNRTASSKLWMSEFSAKTFGKHPSIVIDDKYMEKAGADDYCFIEDGEYSVTDASEVILCHWNRKYPADKFFEADLDACGFVLSDSIDIVGNSHKKITIETYRKNI